MRFNYRRPLAGHARSSASGRDRRFNPLQPPPARSALRPAAPRASALARVPTARAAGGQRRRVVVGAGLAGSDGGAADAAAGQSVLVLEARGRVGGRNLDHRSEPARRRDRRRVGRARPGQVLGLARNWASRPSRPTPPATAHYRTAVSQDLQRRHPAREPRALVELRSRSARQQDGRERSREAVGGAEAGEWDTQTIETWIQQNVHTAEARFLVNSPSRASTARSPRRSRCSTCSRRSAASGGDFLTLVG